MSSTIRAHSTLTCSRRPPSHTTNFLAGRRIAKLVPSERNAATATRIAKPHALLSSGDFWFVTVFLEGQSHPVRCQSSYDDYRGTSPSCGNSALSVASSIHEFGKHGAALRLSLSPACHLYAVKTKRKQQKQHRLHGGRQPTLSKMRRGHLFTVTVSLKRANSKSNVGSKFDYGRPHAPP